MSSPGKPATPQSFNALFQDMCRAVDDLQTTANHGAAQSVALAAILVAVAKRLGIEAAEVEPLVETIGRPAQGRLDVRPLAHRVARQLLTLSAPADAE